MASDAFTEAGLCTALGSRPFRFERQTSSTNDLAREWALRGAPTGSVVIAEEQLAGRGRLGRSWVAPPNAAILMSVILRPRIRSERIGRVMLAGAVAVAETLSTFVRESGAVVRLKWPNDVLLNGRKVAGILAEVAWENETPAAVILGIGLNVRVDFRASPLADRAISLESGANKAIDRLALLASLLQRIDYWSARLGDPALHRAWVERLDTLGRAITVQGLKGELHGLATGVDEDGALLLKTADGTTHTIRAGDVTVLD